MDTKFLIAPITEKNSVRKSPDLDRSLDQYEHQFVISETSHTLEEFHKNSSTTFRVVSKICRIPQSCKGKNFFKNSCTCIVIWIITKI